jgi:hypothetical protein
MSERLSPLTPLTPWKLERRVTGLAAVVPQRAMALTLAFLTPTTSLEAPLPESVDEYFVIWN